MKMNELFKKKQKKVYMEVVESASNKGIETYFDIENLQNLNQVYKDQLLSIFVSGINVLSEGTLSIINTEHLDQTQIPDKK